MSASRLEEKIVRVQGFQKLGWDLGWEEGHLCNNK